MTPREEMALVIGTADGDPESTERLLERYEGTIAFLCSRYFLPCGDSADLLQEARLALIEAAEKYRSDRGASFQTYAELVIERKVMTAVRTANRIKHRSANEALSLAAPAGDEDGDATLADALPGPNYEDPAEQVIAHEALHGYVVRSLRLTDLERKAVAGQLNGESYDDTASALGASPKTVDNALQRARRKLTA